MDDKIQKKRIAYIDIARAIAIIFVVFGHQPTRTLPSSVNIFIWIYSFHIPLFYILTGMTFKTGEKLKDFLKKRAVSILVPYAAFSLIDYIVRFIYSGELQPVSFFSDVLYGTISSSHPKIIWFLPSLFSAQLAYYFIKKINKKSIENIIILSLFIVSCILTSLSLTESLPWGITLIGVVVFFFRLGELAKEKALISKITDNKHLLPVMLISSLIISVVFALINFSARNSKLLSISVGDGVLGNPICFLMSAAFGSLFVLLLSFYIEKYLIRLSGFLSKVGKSTIFIFGMHFFVLEFLITVDPIRGEFADLVFGNYILSLLMNIFLTAVVFFISYAIAIFWMFVWKKIKSRGGK